MSKYKPYGPVGVPKGGKSVDTAVSLIVFREGGMEGDAFEGRIAADSDTLSIYIAEVGISMGVNTKVLKSLLAEL
jgi:hypothetical protein